MNNGQQKSSIYTINALRAGIPVDGDINAGAELCYRISLDRQDIAIIAFTGRGMYGSLTVFDPDGVRIKGRIIDSAGRISLAFVADTAGVYEVRLHAMHNVEEGSYTILLEQIITLKERMTSLHKPRLEGSCIRQLRQQLQTRQPYALDTFWKEVQRSGTPLLETDPAQPHLTLCTFLWQGDETTYNVRVHLLFRTILPNDYTMIQLAGTNLWYTTIQLPSQGRFAYTLLVNTPCMLPPDIDSKPHQKLMYFASAQADPLNPQRCFKESGSRYETMSQLILPDAPPQPWLDERCDIEKGVLERYAFQSKILNDERFITVYTPPGYSKKEQPYGLLLVFDEQWYLTRVPTATILDNLLADKKIPPLVAVVIGNGPGDARSKQLPCNPSFAEFMASELMPWVQEQCHVTDDPRRRIVAGASYGGLAATYVALRYPGVVGNVLSQSGSFWWRPSGKTADADIYKETNYIAALFIESPRLALRFYMDAGTGELDLTGYGRSILSSNRHLRDVLLAKGYEVYYQEFIGGHDFLSWRGTLADGLQSLTSL